MSSMGEERAVCVCVTPEEICSPAVLVCGHQLQGRNCWVGPAATADIFLAWLVVSRKISLKWRIGGTYPALKSLTGLARLLRTNNASFRVKCVSTYAKVTHLHC